MRLYVDTSALVKLYVLEVGSADVEQLVSDAERISVSWVAYAETRSAFARRLRAREITQEAHDQAVADFERDWAQLDRVLVTPPLGLRAGHLAAKHALRGFDALHLASALHVVETDQLPLVMATYDRALQKAALIEGLKLG